jgi:ribosomal protein S18 acetylase RimI-like enzyme
VIARCPTAGDRGAIESALRGSGAFNEPEIRVALDMFEAGLAGDYSLLGIESGGELRAYACFGKAALTERSWYLYWICVDPAVHGAGFGTVLARRIEEAVQRMGGDRLVVETSGRPDYARARRFYERSGYALCGRIPDFYKPGDDCLVYCKMLGAASCA